MNQKKLISTLAILSTVLMIASSGLLLYELHILFGGTQEVLLSNIINESIIGIIHIAFTLYVLFLFFNNKIRFLGIIITILNTYGYGLLDVMLLENMFQSLDTIFEMVLILIFAISLYKKISYKIDIVNTVIFFTVIALVILITVNNIVIFVVDEIYTIMKILYLLGFVLFLLTIYFMSFFQTPLCDKKERLGSSFMIGLGSVLTVVGFVLAIIGNSINNNVSTQMNSFFESGKTGTGDNLVAIGVLLAIVGIILLVAGILVRIFKDKNIGITPKRVIVCRKCGTELSEGAKFCNNCGEPTSDLKMCPKCNAEMPKTAKFCNNCGAAFEINENN